MTGEEIVLAAGTFIVTLLAAAIGGTWAFSRANQELSKEIGAVRVELGLRLDEEIDGTVQRFGETVTAIRAKMTDMELWNRDNFVDKSTFGTFQANLADFFKRFEDKIDRRFDKIDAKLDDR